MCVVWKSHCLILLHILRIWHNELSCAPLIRHFVFIELCTTELVNMKMIRYQYQDKFRYKTLPSKWIIFGYLSWRELCSRSHRTWYCYVIILIISTPTPHLTRPASGVVLSSSPPLKYTEDGPLLGEQFEDWSKHILTCSLQNVYLLSRYIARLFSRTGKDIGKWWIWPPW